MRVLWEATGRTEESRTVHYNYFKEPQGMMYLGSGG